MAIYGNIEPCVELALYLCIHKHEANADTVRRRLFRWCGVVCNSLFVSLFVVHKLTIVKSYSQVEVRVLTPLNIAIVAVARLPCNCNYIIFGNK